MNKKLVAIIAVIVLLIVGGLAFLMIQPGEDNSEASEPRTNMSSPETPDTKEPKPSGRYIESEYDESKLASTEGTRILFFHAPWCPQCRALEADIKDKGMPDGVTIFKVDYDSNQDLRQEYEVTIQTTLVKVDKNGKKLDAYVAYDEPTIESIKENLL